MNILLSVSPPAGTLDMNPGAVHLSTSALGLESSAGEQEGCRMFQNIC